jgi:hypothetical protein
MLSYGKPASHSGQEKNPTTAGHLREARPDTV